MQGCFALVLHAHLPFVRHPEHEKFLEENWLFEAVAESYIPLLQLLESWHREGIGARLTLTLTPTLCSMLRDPLLQSRCRRYLDGLLELADKEAQRTLLDKPFQSVALLYGERFGALREFYERCQGDLVGAFREAQDRGQVELVTSAATHAVLPLLAGHPPSLRAQVLVARDYYRSCFGRDPRGFWLPECAYVEEVDPVLEEAGVRWIILESHGLLQAQPQPRYGTFAPVLTPHGLAAFGGDRETAKQVWSRQEGYPGDPRYRDFYRDVGFDLDLEYVQPYLAAEHRSFTGLKYHRITGPGETKAVYEPAAAARAVDEHSSHFLKARIEQFQRLSGILERRPLVLAPYDAELFGHWWYEGPKFLDLFVRKAWYDQKVFSLVTPEDYLRQEPVQQVATPAASSWGEEGYWRVWLNERNEWIYPHLRVAQERMSDLARHTAQPDALQQRALKQAGRELLLAQASDWPFILRTGTSPDYARKRVTEHLLRFTGLYEQLSGSGLDEGWLREVEEKDNLFPELDYRYWA